MEADALGRFEPARPRGSRQNIRERGCAHRGDYRHGLSGADQLELSRPCAVSSDGARFGRSGAARSILPRDERANRPLKWSRVESGEKAVRGADIVVTANLGR